MITAAICEDETYFAAKLQRLAAGYFETRKLEADLVVFSSGETLLQSGRAWDLVLMDIKLPGRDGMDTAAQLKAQANGSQIIFLTAYPQYVFHAFDLEAVHYLLKPVQPDRLYAALDRAVTRIWREDRQALLLSAQDSTIQVPVKEILYCEAMGHQITVHTFFKRCRFSGTLEDLHRRLDGDFFRCHKSYLVNLRAVTGREAGAVTVANGDKVLIARRKQRELTRRLLEVCQGTLLWP